MKKGTALEGGLAGALALTLVHEIVRRIDPKAPRMDLLGMNALSKIIRYAGEKPPKRNKLFYWTMAGDVITNAFYYSLANMGRKKTSWLRGLLLGVGAGIGAVVLPKPLGLNEAHSNRTVQTKAMTIALYVIGGLVAASVSQLLDNKKGNNRLKEVDKVK